MLAILGFAEAQEEDLFPTKDVAEAVKKAFPDMVFSIQQIELLAQKGIINLDRNRGITNEIIRKSHGSLVEAASNVPLENTDLTKHNILKILALISNHKKKHASTKNHERTRPKRINKGVSFLNDCLGEWYKKNSQLPTSADQLINYCINQLPQGYALIEKDKTKIYWRESGTNQQESLQLRALNKHLVLISVD